MGKCSRFLVISLFLFCMVLMSGCNQQPQEIQQPPDSESAPPTQVPSPEPSLTPAEAVDAVQGWAVLAEKDDFSDVGMTDMLVDYISNKELSEALVKAGWDAENIHELNGFDRESLEQELDWLEEAADEDDIVFFYVATHGNHLIEHILWEEFFKEQW